MRLWVVTVFEPSKKNVKFILIEFIKKEKLIINVTYLSFLRFTQYIVVVNVVIRKNIIPFLYH